MLAFTQFSLISVLIYTVIIYNNHSVIEYKSKVTWGCASCPFLTMLFNLIRIIMFTKISNPLINQIFWKN